MKNTLGACCDDFYTTCRIFLKTEMALERETVLHFFERARREYPRLNRFRRRDEGSLVLEEAEPTLRDNEPKRWIRLDPSILRFGYYAPPSTEAFARYWDFFLKHAPCFLTLSDLEIDYAEVVYGFDLDYCGNHDQLLAETLFSDHPLSSFFGGIGEGPAIDCQPCFGMALSPNCDTQAYIEVKSRTTTYEIRTGDYENQPLSIYLTLRRYWGLEDVEDLCRVFQSLTEMANNLATERVVPLVVNPLAVAIADRP